MCTPFAFQNQNLGQSYFASGNFCHMNKRSMPMLDGYTKSDKGALATIKPWIALLVSWTIGLRNEHTGSHSDGHTQRICNEVLGGHFAHVDAQTHTVAGLQVS